MTHNILNVLRKESTDTLRDRRTIIAAMSYAFLGPLILFVTLSFIADKITDETGTQLAIVGGEYAPNLVRYLEGQSITVNQVERGTDPKQMLGDYHVLLVVKEDYGKQLESGTRAKLWLFVDRTNTEHTKHAKRVRSKIKIFAQSIGEARLLANGVPPVLTDAIQVFMGDVSNSGAIAKSIAGLVLYFFVLAPFFSSLSVSIDTTAGERERRSLQSLLVQPVATRDLIVGKWLTAISFGVVGTMVTVLGGIYALGLAPLDVLGIRLNQDLGTQAWMIVTLVPLALFVAALQILISLAAKRYKEANMYLQLLSIAPAMLGMFMVFGGKTIEGAAAFIPIISQLQGMQDALLGGTFDPATSVLNTAICFALTLLCLMFAARKLGSERILSAA